jgi:hypothetical protein
MRVRYEIHRRWWDLSGEEKVGSTFNYDSTHTGPTFSLMSKWWHTHGTDLGTRSREKRLPCRPRLGDTECAQPNPSHHTLSSPLVAVVACACGGGGARLAKRQKANEACNGNKAERRSRGGGRVRLVSCGGGGTVVAALRRESENLLGGADTQVPRRAAAAAGGGLDSF